jgi:hypothetical protein
MSTPYFPIRPIKLDYIYFHVGRFVTFFADAEEAVVSANRIFMLALNRNPRERPRNTQRRITLFRRDIELVRLTPEQRAVGIALIDKFTELADHRQWIVHGSTWDNSFQTKNPIISLIKSKLGEDDFEFRDYHLADIEALSDECLKLMDRFWDWITIDLGFATPDDVDQARSKIGI